MNLVRKIKLETLIPNSLTEEEIGILKLIDYWFIDLRIFKNKKLPSFTFYVTPTGLYVVEIDDVNKMLIFRFENFYGILIQFMKEKVINDLLKYKIEKILNLKFKDYRIGYKIDSSYKHIEIDYKDHRFIKFISENTISF